MVKQYIPEKGDLVWLDFDPRLGKEQAGKRPALVISDSAYNEKVGLAVFCPVTSKVKGYPFEVELIDLKIAGAVLADHVRNMDFVERKVKFIEKLPEEQLQEVLGKLQVLIFS